MNDEGSRQHYFLPREIQNYLQQELLTNAFEITKVESIKSAQHVVVIVQVQRRTHDDDKDHPLDQVVSSKTNSAVIPDQDDNTVLPHDWQDALNMGCNHLVLRIWKGGCRWWNLHQTTTTTTFHTTDKNCGNNNNNQDDQPQQHKAAAVLTLARAEIAGYRMARLCSESLWTLRHDQGTRVAFFHFSFQNGS
jgi:hypothetical protein